MKRTLPRLTVVLCGCLALSARAQYANYSNTDRGLYDNIGRFDLSAQAGYQVSPTFTYYGGHQKLTDSGSFGGSLGWRTSGNSRQAFRSELFYLFMPSGFTSSNTPETVGLDIHYIQAAALYEVGNDRVRGFFTISLGATVMHPHDTSLYDQWLFSMTSSLGLKLRLVKTFGLRGQVRALVPFYFTGGGVYCGTYGGCGAVATGGGALFQADFTAGPYIEFG